jgi:hypothetical protein
LDFLGTWPFGRETQGSWLLEKLGFPWILSSETSDINGLREILAGKKFARPLAFGGVSGVSAEGLGMQKRRIGHGVTLTWFLFFCNKLPALIALSVDWFRLIRARE